MSSRIIPSQQIQMMPVIDLSQQPVNGQYYAMELPQQPQDQYLSNNQVIIPVATNHTPVETYQHTRVRTVAGPLLAGGVSAALSYATLKCGNFVLECFKKPNWKMSDPSIYTFTAAFAITTALIQRMKLEAAKAVANRHDVVVQKGI